MERKYALISINLITKLAMIKHYHEDMIDFEPVNSFNV